MNYEYLTTENIIRFIKAALTEDIGEGDHSTLSAVPAHAQQRARLLVKDDGIAAGIELAQLIFAEVDKTLTVNVLVKDGDAVKKGDIALTVAGNAQSILLSERLVLNCMQRMSGIATFTRRAVALADGKVKILDTRKTTPNFRLPEKWAVKIGGGTNHRFGLFDMIMLKDNHVDYAGGIKPAISAAVAYKKRLEKNIRIEIETRNLKEVAEVLEIGGVDVIMLDNMSIATMTEAVQMIGGRFETEASGGITLDRIPDIANCGVTSISIGALTHSFSILDLSLKAF